MKTLKLKNGVSIPVIGLGTWKSTGQKCMLAVKKAIELGYRHIDTAEAYGNQNEIGRAIEGFDRKQLFITSKKFRDDLSYDAIVQSCETTLNELRTTYLDLYLVHWPNRRFPMKETLSAMACLRDEGKIRSFGVSNFTIGHLKEALQYTKLPICMNQVEFHPYLYQKELWTFCQKHGIAVTAYSPLAQGKVASDPVLNEIGKKYKKHPNQVALRWLIQKGLVAIPKATSEAHLKSNLDVFDFSLAEEEMRRIDGLSQNHRMVDPEWGDFDYK